MGLLDLFKTSEHNPEEELTPKELLMNKYRELAKTNGTWYTPYVGEFQEYQSLEERFGINGTDITGKRTFYKYQTRHGSYETRDHSVTFDFFGSDEKDFCSAMLTLAMSNYRNAQEKIEEEKKLQREREEAMKEEQKRIKNDRMYMDRYKELSGVSKEFSPHFELLAEMESLTKQSETLIEQWNANHQKIHDIRQKFYSLS